jgi:hypothetical protein
MRTLWLTQRKAFLSQFSIKLQKSAVIEVVRRWHTPCQKEATEAKG